MSTPSLEIKELAFAYPDGNQALFGVNLSVQKGERVALLGPNGTKKYHVQKIFFKILKIRRSLNRLSYV